MNEEQKVTWKEFKEEECDWQDFNWKQKLIMWSWYLLGYKMPAGQKILEWLMGRKAFWRIFSDCFPCELDPRDLRMLEEMEEARRREEIEITELMRDKVLAKLPEELRKVSFEGISSSVDVSSLHLYQVIDTIRMDVERQITHNNTLLPAIVFLHKDATILISDQKMPVDVLKSIEFTNCCALAGDVKKVREGAEKVWLWVYNATKANPRLFHDVDWYVNGRSLGEEITFSAV